MTKLASNPSALQSPAIESGEPLSLIGLDRVDLARVIEPLGVKPFRAQQIFRWIYNHGVSDFSEMTNIFNLNWPQISRLLGRQSVNTKSLMMEHKNGYFDLMMPKRPNVSTYQKLRGARCVFQARWVVR